MAAWTVAGLPSANVPNTRADRASTVLWAPDAVTLNNLAPDDGRSAVTVPATGGWPVTAARALGEARIPDALPSSDDGLL